MIIVSRRLGHENEAFTMNTYGHITADQQEDAVARLDEYMAHKSHAGRNTTTYVSGASASG
jgi:integrase